MIFVDSLHFKFFLIKETFNICRYKIITFYCNFYSYLILVKKGACLGPKLVQHITMHRYNFQIKVVQSQDWLFTMKFSQDLGSMGWVFGPAHGAWVWSLVMVRIVIKLKYCNTPQMHTDTIQYKYWFLDHVQ